MNKNAKTVGNSTQEPGIWKLIYIYTREYLVIGGRERKQATDIYYIPIWISIGTGTDASKGCSLANMTDVEDPEKVNAKVTESEEEGERVLCRNLGITYESSCFYEFLLNLSITKCLTARSDDLVWEYLVMVNPYASKENVFWLMPIPGNRNRKIRETCEMMTAVKELFSTENILAMSIRPLSRSDNSKSCTDSKPNCDPRILPNVRKEGGHC